MIKQGAISHHDALAMIFADAFGRRVTDPRRRNMVYGAGNDLWHCDVCGADVPRDQLHRGPATCMTMCRDCGEL